MPTPIALFPASYDAAYTYYFPILFRFALHQLHDIELSKDLVQETLIQFWKKRDPNITKKKMLESFLFQILKNRMIDHFRKQQLRYQFHNTYDPQKSIEAASASITWAVGAALASGPVAPATYFVAVGLGAALSSIMA